MSVTRTPRLDAIRRREQIAQAERDRLTKWLVYGALIIGGFLLFIAWVRS